MQVSFDFISSIVQSSQLCVLTNVGAIAKFEDFEIVQLDRQTDVGLNFAWHAGVRLDEDYTPARSKVDLDVRSRPKLDETFSVGSDANSDRPKRTRGLRQHIWTRSTC